MASNSSVFPESERAGPTLSVTLLFCFLVFQLSHRHTSQSLCDEYHRLRFWTVVLQLPEFILSASGCEEQETEAKHLWGPVLPPAWSGGCRNTWHWPSDEVAGVLTAQLPPSRRLKPLHSILPPSLSSTEHMLFKNIRSATKPRLIQQRKRSL